MQTADGIPYWKIALMHLDSLASTVLQTCALLGELRPVPVLRHRALPRRRPHDRQEDAGDARRGRGRGQGTRRRGRRHPDHRQHRDPRSRRPVRGPVRQSGEGRLWACPCRCSSSRHRTWTSSTGSGDLGVDSVGIHVETFDPQVLARVAPGKARWGIEAYFAAWQRAVEVFGCRAGVHVRDPRAWARTCGHGRKLQAGGRDGCLPVHRAAPAGTGDHPWRVRAAAARLRRERVPPGGPAHAPARDDVGGGDGGLCPLPGLLGHGGTRNAATSPAPAAEPPADGRRLLPLQVA